MIPKLTDDAVADLPLHGRADLLEEIMRTPVLDDRPVREPATPRRTWAAPVAAASVVALLALTVAWWAARPTPPEVRPAATLAADDQYVVLDAPGWSLTSVAGDATYRSVIYDDGVQNLDISWLPAREYPSRVADRRRINRPPSDGDPIDLLGRPAQVWAYHPDDHTAIREPEGGWTIEIRGEGMDEAAYLDLLGQLRLVDEAGFEEALPPAFAAGADRDQRVADMVVGIQEHVDPLFPDGQQHAITSYAFDPYQLGVDVVATVACAWFDDLQAATDADDDARAQDARDALATARQWPVLQEIDEGGYFPEMVWMLADQAVAGEVPADYAAGLGCEG